MFGVVTRSDGVSPLEGVDVLAEGTSVTTGNDGSYTIMIPKTNPMVKFSKQGYNVICDSISEGGAYNVSMFKPEVEVSMEEDTTPVTPYAMRQVVVQLSNTGDGPLTWSSVVEADVNNGGRRMHPRSSAPMWDHADDVIVTNSNAEQAIATDGYYIYTASWHHAGVFNRYSPDNGYVETFVIDGVGPVRNLSYGNGTFFATDNTNKIYMINMDTQTLENVIELNDPDLQIRYCAYSTEEDLLYIGNWTELYKLVAYNTAYPTMVPLSYSMDNVYSIAYDDFSGTTPCLWAFSQISENNGPFAKIYKLNKNGVQVGGMVHYINDAALASPTSLAGGICVSQNLYGDKFVLLANIQNSNANNNIAVYELKTVRKSLYSGTLSNAEATVKVFSPCYKPSLISRHVFHLWRLRVEWFILCLRLYRERQLIPSSHSVSCHKLLVKRADVIIMVWNSRPLRLHLFIIIRNRWSIQITNRSR